MQLGCHRHQQEGFVRDLFYAANTFLSRDKRPRLSLLEEQRINATTECKAALLLNLRTSLGQLGAAPQIRELRSLGVSVSSAAGRGVRD